MQDIDPRADGANPGTTVSLSPRNRRSSVVRIGGSIGFGLVAVALATVAADRMRNDPDALAQTQSNTESVARTVRVVHPAALKDATLTLPANIEGFQCTSLCARVNGYLKKWHADLGDRVKQGQLLAEIDTPELDQELEEAKAKLAQGQAELETARAELVEAQSTLKQAIADVARAKANLDYSRGVLNRNSTLTEQRVISQQDFDDSQREFTARQADSESAEALRRTRESNLATRAATIKSRDAAVNSLTAVVRRLEKMQGFKRIIAPFDGLVIRRRAEVGMLVVAGGAQASQELFAMVQADRLRIKINVPQTFAPSIELGQSAKVLTPEYPNRPFEAKIARTSKAIDPAARTLAVELELANPNSTLLPGAFARVILNTRRSESLLTIPINALLARAEGSQVAVVDSDKTVSFRTVELGRDYGRTVEVPCGLQAEDFVVLNPPDDLKDGEKVDVAESTP